MNELTPTDRAEMGRLQAVHEVLRVLVISLGAMNPKAMPKVAHALRAATTNDALSAVARVMLWDLADGIDVVTGADTEH